jgi:N-acetylneuraminate synthase
MSRCAFDEGQERELKNLVESYGMLYLCTPFSRAAADRLERMKVRMYKIGSGECNNYPLIKHIASFGKPIILSTGMNGLDAIDKAVDAVGNCSLTLLHCVSMYPTPYDKVHLGAMLELKERYHVPVGLSDHSQGLYTAFAAVALGASVVEKHFVSDKSWPGPDVPISITPAELYDLVQGEQAIQSALQGTKQVLEGEQPTIDFAYACVVSTEYIHAGELLTDKNVWVKRPGTGEILAVDYERVLGRTAIHDIPKDMQIRWSDFGD